MSPPVLHYFNGRGKAETIRLMFAAAGVKFVEAPFITEPSHMEKLRKEGLLLFEQVPMLQMDGKNIVQSGAIVRYIANKYKLYGNTDEDRLQIDMLSEGAKDFLNFFMFFEFGDNEKVLENIRKKALPRYMPIYEKIISESGSGFLVGDKLSMADVCLLEVLLHLPERTPEAFEEFPKLKQYMERVSSVPSIKTYLQGPQRKPPNDQNYVKTVRHALNWHGTV